MLKKRVLPLFLALVIILNCGFYANAASDTDIAKATRVLLQSGWTQEEIDDLLTEEALLEFADVEEAFTQEKYYRVKDYETEDEVPEGECIIEEISEEQCRREITQINMIENVGGAVSPLSTIPVGTTIEKNGGDSYIKLTAYAYNAGNREYVFSARFEWVNSPYSRCTDVFALCNSNKLQLMSSPNVYYVFKANCTKVDSIANTTQTSEYVTYSPKSMNTSDLGVAVTQKLMTDIIAEPGISTLYTKQKGYIQYRAKVSQNDAAGGSIRVNYYHGTVSITGSVSISFDSNLGISLSPSIGYSQINNNPYLDFDI